jgi:HD-GYP domain-containing protein (c-di-GMP phosphodiesterase class II)
MGKVMNLTKDHMDELKLAGLLHDIGKISIPDRILTKPGKLDQDEWEIMKKHTIYGYNILRAADEYSNLALYALTHHEKYDGTGYPKGLSKDEIPLFSRIISVIDAYEAMTADRPYRKAPGKEFAVQELIRCKNTQFDPHIVDLFLSEVLKWKQ